MEIFEQFLTNRLQFQVYFSQLNNFKKLFKSKDLLGHVWGAMPR